MMNLKQRVQLIVQKATILKDTYKIGKHIPVNYACIFSQSQQEYDDLLKEAHKMGKVVKETPTGFLFHIKPLETISGVLKLLKIRIPDKTRPELGDADFTVLGYEEFKQKVLGRKEFTLIPREGFEMIELMDPKFDVRVYFSNPPVGVVLGI